uniref:Uncharacterized protein n=1 Tax=Denticeps clupeoides TaxID=299321 RepID=A0AAY4CL19_9TELE
MYLLRVLCPVAGLLVCALGPGDGAVASRQRAPPRCRLGTKPCRDGTGCVLYSHVCDREADCDDGSDEEDCPEPSDICSSSEFRCTNGQCVSMSVRCDGHTDCRDHSDEEGCAKPPPCSSKHRCPHSHECLLADWFCDGEEDCRDGTDEKVKEWRTLSLQGRSLCFTFYSLYQTPLATYQSDLQSVVTGTVSLEQLRVKCLAQGHNGSKWDLNLGLLVDRQVCYPLGYYHLCFGQNPDFFPPEPLNRESTCQDIDHMTETDITADMTFDSTRYINNLVYLFQNCKKVHLECGEFQLTCASRTQCIPKIWKCDGTSDCADGSDEAGCKLAFQRNANDP